MDTQGMESGTVEVLFSAETISQRLAELAGEIKSVGMERILVVAALKGSFVFAADLIRALHGVGIAPEVDYIALQSYKKSKASPGSVEILRDLDLDVAGRNVLLVQDVLSSGRTMAFIKDLLAARGAASVRTCVFIEKQIPRAFDVGADFAAFACEDWYVVGYGMDADYRFRELPYTGRIVSRGT